MSLGCKSAVLSLIFWFLDTINLGTVQHVCSSGLQKCCTAPKFLVPRHKNLGTVQHFCNPEEQKCCTVPNFFGFSLKSVVLSLKQHRKPILQNLQGLPSLKVLENSFFFFRFFSDSTALFNEQPKKIGTVQHFCNPEEQKCCTVPDFLVPRHEKFRDSTARLLLWIAKVLYCP